MTKAQYRSHFKALRDRAANEQASAAICRLLLASPVYHAASRIMTYLSFGSEPDTLALARTVLSDGKALCVPVCNPADCTMTPCAVYGMDELQPGHYGILEPAALHPVPPGSIDLVVVPGIAFDRMGHRIGYGKGYYDRFLSQTAVTADTVGLCFDPCLVDALPHDAYDIPVRHIITPSGMLDSQDPA